MTSEPKPDPSVKPPQEAAKPEPQAGVLDPRVRTEACSDLVTTDGGSDPCGGSGGKGDNKGI